MAAYYTGAALALLRWARSRSLRDAAFALFLAVACTQIKDPGLVWALTLVPGVVVALLPRQGPRFVAIGLRRAVRARRARADESGHPRLPAASRFRSGVARARRDALPARQLASALVRRARRRAPRVAPARVAYARAADRRRGRGALFLIVVFSFTNARLWVTEQTTINRATLHIAPLAAVFAVLAFRAFAATLAAPRTAPATAAPYRRRRDARHVAPPRMLELRASRSCARTRRTTRSRCARSRSRGRTSGSGASLFLTDALPAGVAAPAASKSSASRR